MDKQTPVEKIAELSTLELSPGQISTLPRDTEKLVIAECSCADWLTLFQEIHKLKHLKWLALSTCKIDDATLRQLVDTLPHLEWLGLDHNELTIKSLSELSRMHRLTFLSLNSNHFDKDSMGAFIELVLSLKKLKEVNIRIPDVHQLNLENANLDAREVEILTKTFNQIKRLDLSGSKLYKDAVLSIIDNCHHLEELSLRQCHLDDKEIELLAGKYPNLHTLYLNDNKITATGVVEIVKHMVNLKRFYISKNHIGDDGAVVIASNLKLLQELGVVSCKLDERGIVSIAQGLPHLTKLYLYHDHMTDECAESIVFNLKKLETLDLDDTKLSDKAALMIARHIPLKHYMINKNHLKPQTIAEIKQLLPGAVSEPAK